MNAMRAHEVSLTEIGEEFINGLAQAQIPPAMFLYLPRQAPTPYRRKAVGQQLSSSRGLRWLPGCIA